MRLRDEIMGLEIDERVELLERTIVKEREGLEVKIYSQLTRLGHECTENRQLLAIG
jgi:hypothetical protein